MTGTVLSDIGARLPVIAAPMAGGPTTAELVIAASRAGGLGFVAGGYKSAAELAHEVATVRASTDTYGVNLFVPNPVPVDPAAYSTYLEEIRVEGDRLGVDLPPAPREDDDHWRDKIDVLLQHPVPIVSFTFAIPESAALQALRRAGSILVQTVTSVDEALRAAEAGVGALVIQAPVAGGHSATLTPGRIPADRSLSDLLTEIDAAVGLPKIAAGGLFDAAQVASVLARGAEMVMVGTALLLAPEAGTNGSHRKALLGIDRGPTIVTRAFSGRPARALPNVFTDRHHAQAPSGYPAVHYLTSPIRKSAAAAGDPENVNLWAGTGYRRVREQPIESTLTELSDNL